VEAAVMILTDDNFGGMFGYIATFLGASIFDIARGVPLRGGRRDPQGGAAADRREGHPAC
jgi:hypothetical protein